VFRLDDVGLVVELEEILETADARTSRTFPRKEPLVPTQEPSELDRFSHAEAWHLGRGLVERSIRESLSVTISITIGDQRVFHAAMAGTSADNDAWVARKSEIVRRFDLSSLGVYERQARDSPDFYRVFGLSEVTYAAAGGAVPIRVRGTTVGVLAISGLSSEADHQLAVDALADLARIGIDAVGSAAPMDGQ
jgi:uncharacterized protein (UPF0303 family)